MYFVSMQITFELYAVIRNCQIIIMISLFLLHRFNDISPLFYDISPLFRGVRSRGAQCAYAPLFQNRWGICPPCECAPPEIWNSMFLPLLKKAVRGGGQMGQTPRHIWWPPYFKYFPVLQKYIVIMGKLKKCTNMLKSFNNI